MNRKIGNRLKPLRWSTVLLLIPLVSACSSFGSSEGKSAAIDPPPSQIEEAMLQQSEGTADGSATPSLSGETPVKPTVGQVAPEDSVTVYLLDEKGYLAPMTLRLPSGETPASESVQAGAETAMTWLTKDPKRIDQLPEGFSAVLPEGAKVDSVKLDTDSGTVSIDFADPLPAMPANEERKMLEAVVWTMTELPGMDKVKLSVGGRTIRSLPASKMPVDEVLTRGIGINVEEAKGVKIAHSMGVTLYFSARSASGDGYFVPVTRLIDRTPDRMRAALDELIKGPLDTKALQAVVQPGFTVDGLKPLADTVNVSLRDDAWSAKKPVPSDMMEAIVLTMTEAAGTPQVKVAINGDDSFLDSDQRSYDRPVTRPAAVNMLER